MEEASIRCFDVETYRYFQDFEFKEPIRAAVICPKCKSLLRAPLQLGCGHRICTPCFEDLSIEPGQRIKLCPVEFEEIRDLFPDRSALLEIIKIEVYCPFRKKGCSWVGIIFNFLKHVRKECKFATNWILCEFSSIGCERKGKKEEVDRHQKEDSYMHLACLAKALKRCSSVLDHASSLKESILLTNADCQKKLEENSDKVIAISMSLEGLESRVVNDRSAIEQLSIQQSKALQQLERISYDVNPNVILTGTNELYNSFQALNEMVEKTEREVKESPIMSETIASDPNLVAIYDPKLKRIEKERKMRRENLADADLKIRLFQATTTNGRYIWKIDNYPRRMREAKEGKILELYSPPLFTDVFGYKVCCKIYLNGKPSEEGHGANVSFYMILMKGEYDALLKFPFPRIFRATLLAHDDCYNIERSIEPKDTEPFQRAKEEMNPTVGYRMFVSHEELATSKYLWDDSLFFKIDFTEKSSSFS